MTDLIRTVDEVPNDVQVAFRFAQALWPQDPVAGSTATLIAWAQPLSGYSTDELCSAFEALAPTSPKFPNLYTLTSELRSQERSRARELAPPVLEAPRPPKQVITGPDTAYRAKLRADALKAARRGDGTVDPQRRDEIHAWVDEVGPYEAAFLKTHGISVAVTRPERGGGNLRGESGGAGPGQGQGSEASAA